MSELDPINIGSWPDTSLENLLDYFGDEPDGRNATLTIGRVRSLVREILELRERLREAA